MANGAPVITARSEVLGANDVDCVLPIAKPAMMKTAMRISLSMVQALWNAPRNLTPLADPALKARLAALGADPMVMGPAEFGKLIADETEKWAKVIKFAGIKAE